MISLKALMYIISFTFHENSESPAFCSTDGEDESQRGWRKCPKRAPLECQDLNPGLWKSSQFTVLFVSKPSPQPPTVTYGICVGSSWLLAEAES